MRVMVVGVVMMMVVDVALGESLRVVLRRIAKVRVPLLVREELRLLIVDISVRIPMTIVHVVGYRATDGIVTDGGREGVGGGSLVYRCCGCRMIMALETLEKLLALIALILG